MWRPKRMWIQKPKGEDVLELQSITMSITTIWSNKIMVEKILVELALVALARALSVGWWGWKIDWRGLRRQGGKEKATEGNMEFFWEVGSERQKTCHWVMWGRLEDGGPRQFSARQSSVPSPVIYYLIFSLTPHYPWIPATRTMSLPSLVFPAEKGNCTTNQVLELLSIFSVFIKQESYFL